MATQYKVRLVYKSGYTHDLWFNSLAFEVKADGLNVAWESAETDNAPLFIGPLDIAAIFQLGSREVPDSAVLKPANDAKK